MDLDSRTHFCVQYLPIRCISSSWAHFLVNERPIYIMTVSRLMASTQVFFLSFIHAYSTAFPPGCTTGASKINIHFLLNPFLHVLVKGSPFTLSVKIWICSPFQSNPTQSNDSSSPTASPTLPISPLSPLLALYDKPTTSTACLDGFQGHSYALYFQEDT